MKKKIGLMLMWILITAAAGAQNQNQKNVPVMPKPAFGAELAKLGYLSGDFTTRSAIPANPAMPQGAKGLGRAKNTWDLDSMFLSVEENGENSLFGKYKQRGFLTYDRQEKKYVLSMFNNFGDHPVYKGEFRGDTLVLESLISMPGAPFTQRLFWYPDGHNVKLQIFNDMGKGPALVTDQTYMPASSGTNAKTKK